MTPAAATTTAPTTPTTPATRPHRSVWAVARAYGQWAVVSLTLYFLCGGIWGLTMVGGFRSDGSYVSFDANNPWPDVSAWFTFLAVTSILALISGPIMGTRAVFATNPASTFFLGLMSIAGAFAFWAAGAQTSALRYPHGGESMSALTFAGPGVGLLWAPTLACLSYWIYLCIRYLKAGEDDTPVAARRHRRHPRTTSDHASDDQVSEAEAPAGDVVAAEEAAEATSAPNSAPSGTH